jgi:hypothetical protein
MVIVVIRWLLASSERETGPERKFSPLDALSHGFLKPLMHVVVFDALASGRLLLCPLAAT